MFIDIGVLLDFCDTDSDYHQETKDTLEEFNGKISTCSQAKEEFVHRIHNVEEILGYLIDKLGELRDSWENFSKKEKEGKLDSILDESNLKEVLSLYPTKTKMEGLEGIKKLVQTKGPVEAQIEIMSVMDEITPLNYQIHSKVDQWDYASNKNWPMLRAYLNNIVETEFQAEILIEAVMYSRNNRLDFVLSRETGKTFQEKDRINGAIEGKLSKRDCIKIHSPLEIKRKLPATNREVGRNLG